MRKSLIGVAAGGLMATAAFGAAAFAHPNTYTVEVAGSSAAGSHLAYASDVAGIQFNVKRPSDGLVTAMDCADVNAEAEVYSGSGVDPIAVIKPVDLLNAPDIVTPVDKPHQATDWKTCTGPFGAAMGVNQLDEWEIHATGPATSGNTDVVEGYISGPNNEPLHAQVFALSGGKNGTQCNFIVEGYAYGEFNEATQTLNVNHTGFGPELTVLSTTGDCLGTVPAGSRAEFVGSFKIGADDAANTKGNITVPLPVNILSTP